MYKFILLLGICSALASDSKPPEKAPAKHTARIPVADKCSQIVGCYYVNNENEQVDPTLNIEMIDVSLCSHLFYNTAFIGKNGSVELLYECTDCPGMEWNSFERVNDLRKRNRRFKTLVAMEEASLKEKFDKDGFILALAVDARESTANKYDIKEISEYVSFINLRAYNFHGDRTYDPSNIVKAGHIAPLYHSSKENAEDRKLNVDYIVKYWLSKGTPPNKLILGTTFNGLEYNLANPKQVGRDAPVVEDPKYALRDPSYYYTCPWEKTRVWTTFWDKEQQVPYISKREKMIAYDSVASIKLKAEYAKRMQLGGVFADSIEGDDFSGHCGGEKFPLLTTLSRVLRDKC
ncbi:probable chitinase 10 [Belonocnema kinseyi]|uniref:probable chitinase 10 n=1 Tax=Belonocnema kinseyi TaxID=2817044 RepID=UPI00143DE81E|nr:probable chitinase 10 [Belonocnema kinseyi]